MCSALVLQGHKSDIDLCIYIYTQIIHFTFRKHFYPKQLINEENNKQVISAKTQEMLAIESFKSFIEIKTI